MRLTLSLNHACNLRCSYCYTGDKFQRRMSWEVAQRGVDLVLRHSPPGPARTQISFFGGEPLLELPLMRQVIDYARQRASHTGHEMLFHVATNATLMTADVVDTLVREQVQVAVSLDGNPAAHDATRRYPNGASSYAEVATHLAGLLERMPGGAVTVQSVVDPANVAFLADSFDHLLTLGARDLRHNINYSGAWTDDALHAYDHALTELGDRYVAAYRRGMRFTLRPLDDKIVSHLRGPGACDRCDFGTEELAVAPSGRLYPCDRLIGEDDRDALVIGDVFHGVDTAARDALTAAKDHEAPDCAACALRERCRHFCGCVNHELSGNVGVVHGLLCWFEQRLIHEADRCASLLHAEGAPAFSERFYPRGLSRPSAPARLTILA